MLGFLIFFQVTLFLSLIKTVLCCKNEASHWCREQNVRMQQCRSRCGVQGGLCSISLRAGRESSPDSEFSWSCHIPPLDRALSERLLDSCQTFWFACILSRHHKGLVCPDAFFSPKTTVVGLIKNIVSAIQQVSSRSHLSRLVCFVLFNQCF